MISRLNAFVCELHQAAVFSFEHQIRFRHIQAGLAGEAQGLALSHQCLDNREYNLFAGLLPGQPDPLFNRQFISRLGRDIGRRNRTFALGSHLALSHAEFARP